MFKNLLILLLSILLLFSCSKKDKKIIISEPTDEEKAISIYAEAVDALNKGDAFYAGKKFKDVETLVPQSKWAEKASLMASYADYTRNSYYSGVVSCTLFFLPILYFCSSIQSPLSL